MLPLSDQEANIAVNGTWEVPEYSSVKYHNLSLAICNPVTKEQVPGGGGRSFLFTWCMIGLGISTFMLLLGICLPPSILKPVWWMKLKTLDPHGGWSEDVYKQASKTQSLMLFFTQDLMFLIALGFYTFSCAGYGTFSNVASLVQYLVSVVNVFRRLGGLIWVICQRCVDDPSAILSVSRVGFYIHYWTYNDFHDPAHHALLSISSNMDSLLMIYNK